MYYSSSGFIGQVALNNSMVKSYSLRKVIQNGESSSLNLAGCVPI